MRRVLMVVPGKRLGRRGVFGGALAVVLLFGLVGCQSGSASKGQAFAATSVTPSRTASVAVTHSASKSPSRSAKPKSSSPKSSKTSTPKPSKKKTKAPATPALDPRFATCKAAKAHGYGPYHRGKDPEYAWYRDSDGDGVDCE